ncbi:hypothetical protein F3N42_10525 [Marinihelvus fidelis]|uniref:Coenzyme Q-binding protein COQ10 START domain-containing protein n=1 Tax=Marinihelvus fidelis TaxID=2613842 RepID=A0A5N0TBT3_9GAMM|nr:SRPBCC family protein [Marinihelvus fidelis]KAA9130799.1 hypothetical protein F3N42_10525 [Marinihelvus fidelis]
MRRVLVWLCVFLLLAQGTVTAADGLPGWAVAPPRPQPDAATLARLRDGEILVEAERGDDGGGRGFVQAWFAGDPGAAWQRLQDCPTNLAFISGLEDCELLSSSTHSAVTRHVLKRAWYLPRREYVFETVRQPVEWLRVRLLSGELRALDGYWRFDPMDGGGYLVTHDIQVRPGFMAPGWWVRRTLERDLPDLLACLRSISEASPSAVTARADAERCPR